MVADGRVKAGGCNAQLRTPSTVLEYHHKTVLK
jgi:hypothetical protein